MPVRQLNRQQTWLLPPTLDELIPDDHPVRFLGMVVDSLDNATWHKLNIELEGDPHGAPAYHPRAMLGVWLYGFMTGTRSSRKLESACRDQIPYLWLTGWQHPDHNSLWRFYRGHRDEMRQLFKMTVKTAVKMDLVDLAVQAIDGSKIAANASKDRTYDNKGLSKLLERTEKVIQELEKENESGEDPAPVHLPEKLRKAEQLREEVKTALSQLESTGKKNINLTDSEAKLMKSQQGFIAGYNLEAVVSPLKISESIKTGLFLTAAEVVTEPIDAKQLIPMLEQAEENSGKKAEKSLADAGFHSGANLEACEQRGQVIIMPESQGQTLSNPYHKDKFIYDVNTNSYKCPNGQILKFVKRKKARQVITLIYRSTGKICRKCPSFGICTRNKIYGRELQVGLYDAEIKRHREWMKTAEARETYKHRKEIIEPSFGIIKEVMGIRRLLLRGLANVRAEVMVLALAFNLRTLYGVWKTWKLEKLHRKLILIQQTGKYIVTNQNIFSFFQRKALLNS